MDTDMKIFQGGKKPADRPGTDFTLLGTDFPPGFLSVWIGVYLWLN